jgi:hypothetical protein
MKITAKTLMVSFEHDVKVGNNDAIEAKLVHQAFIYECEDGSIGYDLDFCDVVGVKFLGIPIEGGYQGYKKFKAQMMELGIDVDKLMDEAAAKLVTDGEMDELKQMYRSTIKRCKK